MSDGRKIERAACDALGELERAMSHFEKAAANCFGCHEEMRSGMAGVRRAAAALKVASLDRVYASTGAEHDGTAPGNVVVGVTAHCACGRVFADDVRCCAPKLPPPAGGQPRRAGGCRRGR